MFESIKIFTIINSSRWNASDEDKTSKFLSNFAAYLLYNLPKQQQQTTRKEKCWDCRPKQLVNPVEPEKFY